jgi:hypothetical protein
MPVTRGALGLGLAGSLGVALSLLRQRGAGALDTLWAEDGSIFLQDALRDPSPVAWLDGYAGYLHLAPRLVGSIAALLPIDLASELLTLGGAAATAGVAIVTYRAAREHIPTSWVRLVLGLAVLLLPPAGIEGMNAAANIHWYLLYAGVWVSLWRPAGAGGAAAGAGVMALTAASDPFAVLYAPVLGWRLLGPRRRGDWAFAGALAAGLAVQAAVVLASSGERALDPGRASLVDLGRWYGFRVLETAAFGVTLRDFLTAALGVVPAALLAVGALAALLAPALRAARQAPGVPAALAALHLGLYFLPAALAGTSPLRYSIAPILTLYALIAWGLVRAPGWSRSLAALALGLLGTAAVLDYAPWNERADGPRWSQGVAGAAGRCAADGAAAAAITIPPLPAPLRDDPSRTSRLWSVEVPCGKLRDRGIE